MTVDITEKTLHINDNKFLFIKKFTPDTQAKYNLILVHGTAGHGQCYDSFSKHMAAYSVNVYAFDLTGHGKSSGKRGIFTFEEFLEDIKHISEDANKENDLPIILHGASQGGEVAFHALNYCEQITAAVCMNVLLNSETAFRPAIKFMQSGFAGVLEKILGNNFKVPLLKFINFKSAYQEDPTLLNEKKKDPLYVWKYGYKSYRSIFTYKPSQLAKDNKKPILITVGEEDDIVSMVHCKKCFDLMGGEKDFFSLPGGGHQLMMFETKLYSRIIHSWVKDRVLEKKSSWKAEFLAEEQQYFDFLKKQKQADQFGEKEYNYSWLDKLLINISNGSIERGVRYFSNADFSEQWKFTEKLVSKIDYNAWHFLKDYVPSSNQDERPKIAVLGCGNGGAIEGILKCCPEFKNWDIVGVDVDYKAIRRAKENYKDKNFVSFIAGDASLPDVLVENAYNIIHVHGIFDHCTEHKALLENVFKALKPQGRLFYVTPDRNIFTWLSFVFVGPLFIFKMYKSIHDFRRFPRPNELNKVFIDVGFSLVKHKDESGIAVTGLDYKNVNPFLVRKAVKTSNLDLIEYIHTGTRWFLGGYLGEYVGVVEK